MGFPVDRQTVYSLVCQITDSAHPPSRGWVKRFLARHQGLKLGKPSGLDPQRAQAFNRHTVDNHFKKLKAIIDEYKIPWSHVYNMDEKGIQHGGARRLQRIKYFVPRGRRVNYKLRSNNLELMTIIECVSADGGNILLGFIFAGAQFYADLFRDVDPEVVLRNENVGLLGQVQHANAHAKIANWHLGQVQQELNKKKSEQEEAAREAAREADERRKAEEERTRQTEREQIVRDDHVCFSGALSRKVKDDLKDIVFARGLPMEKHTNAELCEIIKQHLKAQVTRYSNDPKFSGLYTATNSLASAQKRPLPADLNDENSPPPASRRQLDRDLEPRLSPNAERGSHLCCNLQNVTLKQHPFRLILCFKAKI
ncbi:hypothetical protein BV20DRAFT_1055052 [Pilatotrama ljubarskyi]|nr:hypothetical protein BV20DRAFT_1055052 [Pilatotrama ljubarskyi]